MGAYNVGDYNFWGSRFGIQNCTYLCGGLQCGGLQCGGLQFLGQPIWDPELHILVWGPTMWWPTISRATDFGIPNCTYLCRGRPCGGLQNGGLLKKEKQKNIMFFITIEHVVFPIKRVQKRFPNEPTYGLLDLDLHWPVRKKNYKGPYKQIVLENIRRNRTE